MAKPSVYVAGMDRFISKMWFDAGYTLEFTQPTADIVCYVGGMDLNPEMYGQQLGPKMRWGSVSLSDDARDLSTWRRTRENKKPQLSVGICRGGQALNVFNGGQMYQHVSGHANGDHKIFDALIDPGSQVNVNSSHHQMMIPTADGEVLAYSEGVSSEYWGDQQNPLAKPQYETEVVWYDKTQSLCVQFHPEWGARGRADQPHECQEYFFNLVDMVR